MYIVDSGVAEYNHFHNQGSYLYSITGCTVMSREREMFLARRMMRKNLMRFSLYKFELRANLNHHVSRLTLDA